MKLEFDLMRSLIYVDVVKEQYRHKLLHWLYYHHVPESMSQFAPYVTKYAFYNALPTPPEGERFGTIRLQLTEHYWLVNPNIPQMGTKAFTEYFPAEVLKWQGTLPDDECDTLLDGDEARCTGGNNNTRPFVFAFVPVCWEEDIKGPAPRICDGVNYRWQFIVGYPAGITEQEGDAWLMHEVLPVFEAKPEVRRILSSRIIRNVSNCPFHRVVEMWFNGPEEWHKAVVRESADFPHPAWAQEELFPYLTAYHNFTGIFLTDFVSQENFSMYRGYQAMR